MAQKKTGPKAKGGDNLGGVSPEQILSLIKLFGEYAPIVIEMLKKMGDLWKSPQVTAKANRMIACPAGEDCADAMMEKVAEMACLAMHCKKCCSPSEDDEEETE